MQYYSTKNFIKEDKISLKIYDFHLKKILFIFQKASFFHIYYPFILNEIEFNCRISTSSIKIQLFGNKNCFVIQQFVTNCSTNFSWEYRYQGVMKTIFSFSVMNLISYIVYNNFWNIIWSNYKKILKKWKIITIWRIKKYIIVYYRLNFLLKYREN